MKSLYFDKELDNDVSHYNLGKHVPTMDEYKQCILLYWNWVDQGFFVLM